MGFIGFKKSSLKIPWKGLLHTETGRSDFTTDLTTHALCKDLQNIFEKLQKNGGNFFGESF